ncbi:MAG: radical SAM protein [Sphingobacteriales bacterium]|nr:radical SAM protein [Sphingobacteriales bacterium]
MTEHYTIADFHLRFFLESICNFRCVYCNPDADRQEGKIISDSEIKNILAVGYSKGISKVHYSGGEPTLRRGLPEIIRFAKNLGYTDQVMTTNGVLFEKKFDVYIDSGLTRVNISIDSLKEDIFNKLTGSKSFHNVMRAIEKAVSHFEEVKLNVVIMKENIEEINDFISFSAKHNNKIVCRFIELQSNQPVFYDNKEKISDQHVNLDEIVQQLERYGEFNIINSIKGKNPNCRYYQIKNTGTRFGIIANHSRGYPCGNCKKIRISPYGGMGVCINAEGLNIKNANEQELIKAFDMSIEMRHSLDEHFAYRKHHSDTYGFWRWG